MPTYEYRCRDCDHLFEVVQPMKDDALTVCPECGGTLRKVFGAPMISFKGSGFYATDHGKKSKTPAEQKEQKQGADSSTSAAAGSSSSEPTSPDAKSGSEKKGESAPAAKPESPSGSKAEPKSSGKKEPMK